MSNDEELEALTQRRQEINQTRDLKAKIDILPSIPAELPFDCVEIANLVQSSKKARRIYKNPLINSDGYLTPEAYDFFIDEVDNESEIIESLKCYGDGDIFYVNIMCWEGIYWVQANEFDDIGYFIDYRHAKFHAEDIAKSYPLENNE